MQRGSDNERRDRTEMQRQRDRDYAKELCASRLAFTLSRTGTSKEDYCRAVGISSSRGISRTRACPGSWDCRRTIESHRFCQALKYRTA